MKTLSLIFAAAAIAAAACGAAPQTETHYIEIKQMQFVPAELEVAPGDSVIWTNEDIVQHNVVEENDGSWESEFLSKGESFGIKITESGTLSYLCTIHPVMKGKIMIKNK